MILKKQKSILVVFMVLVCCMIIKYSDGFTNVKGSHVTDQHGSLDELFSETRTLCFGRFLVDIPKGATVIYGPASVESEILFKKNGSRDMVGMITARLNEIKKEADYIPKYDISELPKIGSAVDGAVRGQKILFGAVNSVGYVIDSFVPIGSDLFFQKFGPVPSEVDYLPRINAIASQLRLRDESEIPSEDGICIEGGFVALDPVRERMAIGLRFEKFPDVRLSIDAHKNQEQLPSGSNPKKLREEAKLDAEALGLGSFFSKIHVIRSGKRQLGAWDGEELVTRRPAYKEDTESHEFRFYSTGAINDALQPELDIRLDSGVRGNAKAKVKPSITDEEATELWDKIISSIRVRRASDATPALNPLPKVALGTMARSGEICSQSGIWECVANRQIEGERQRSFKEGARLPPVIGRGGTGFWRTLIGDIYRVREVNWRLLGYENTDSVKVTAVVKNDIRNDLANKVRPDA